MIFLRSLVFQLVFMPGSALVAIACVLCFPLPDDSIRRIAKFWSRTTLVLLKCVCGLDYRVEGRENLPRGERFIIASKHQSAWETIAYQYLFGPAVFMFKREILYIPLFGISMLRMGNIMVNRGATTKSGLARLVRQFRRALKRRNVIVFPEGTRKPFGAKADYKSGLSIIASSLEGVAIVPVAMDSGRFWPKGSFLKRPGTIRVLVLPPIRAQSRREIQERLESSIETAMVSI